MDVTPLVQSGQQIIQSYAGGKFKVSGVAYNGPIIVTPSMTIEWDGVDLNALDIDAFHSVLEQSDQIDVVLLGCGSRMVFVPPALRNSLKDKGLSIDSMGTDAACRTYNVLMAEGRRVAACLLPV